MLRAVSARLVPLGGLHLPERFAAMLAQGPGEGWRHADMPPAREAHGEALRRLAREGFADLDPQAQDAMLSAVQSGRPPEPAWPFPPQRWFEGLLSSLVRLAYGHPLAQVAIGVRGLRRRAWAAAVRMSAPAGMRRHAEADVVDALIIGSGAGGAPLAWRLARAGCSGRHAGGGPLVDPPPRISPPTNWSRTSCSGPTSASPRAPIPWRSARTTPA